jgi:hypothetical protein
MLSMTVSTQQALEVARTYVANNYPGAAVTGLLQDDRDFLVTLEASSDALPIGWAFIFISKANGRVRTEAPGDGFDQMALMTEV